MRRFYFFMRNKSACEHKTYHVKKKIVSNIKIKITKVEMNHFAAENITKKYNKVRVSGIFYLDQHLI